MPQAVVAWIASAAGIAQGTIAYAAIQAGVGLAINLAVSKIFQPKGPGAQEAQAEIRQSDAPRTRYLGRNRVSGVVHYWETHEDAMWKLLAVAQGGHNGVVDWYADEDKLTVVDGTVTNKFNGAVNLWARTGRGAQFAGGQYPQLLAAAPEWTTDHRMDGIGTVLGRFACIKAEDAPDIYPGGEPKITAVIEGDSVGHPGGAPIGPSSNLARQLYDILCHDEYGVVSASDLDAPSWLQAIADCDAPVPTAGGTRPRYAGGGGYRLAEPIKDVADRWAEGMAATVYTTVAGKIAIRVGKWIEPTYTITSDKIVSMEYGTGIDEIDGVSSLTPKYVSPELDYRDTTADPVEDAAAIAQWGETAAKEIPLPVVQHYGQANSIARIKLAKMNPKWRFTMRLRFWGLLLMEEATVYVTLPHLGIENEPFWIDEYAFSPADQDGVCTVTLIHAVPASFTVSAETEGTPPSVPPETSTGVTGTAPIATSAVVVREAGTAFIRATGQVSFIRAMVGQYRLSGTTDPWLEMTEESVGGSLRTAILADKTSYDVRLATVRARFMHTPISEWVYINNIQVQYNITPPEPPVLVTHSGSAGGTFSVTFEPDLGVNYDNTELWRGALGSVFADATFRKRSFATSAQVTMTEAVPAAGARYWIVSVNPSGVKSAPVFVRSAA